MSKHAIRRLPGSQRLDALHLVALGIDEVRKRGTPQHAAAVAIKEKAIDIWKEQLWKNKTCPHCGHKL
jgi:hypothetical protein